jgi:integrase
MHHSLAGTPQQANNVLRVASKAFSLAELWEMRPEGSNPCRRIDRNPGTHRERFLSADGLGRLGETLRQAEARGLPWKQSVKKYPRVITAAIELLLFTGCRLSEVLNLKWDQVDFKAGTIALLETKAGRPQLVMMNAEARQVLKGLGSAHRSPWVLPALTDECKRLPKSTIEQAWQGIRAGAKLHDVPT